MNKKEKIAAVIVVIFGIVMMYTTYVLLMADSNEDKEEHDLGVVTFHLGDSDELQITCEVADTDSERQIGLQNRSQMAQDQGMIFVYDHPVKVAYSMKDMLIPLDIIFISPNKTVLKVVEADVETGISYENLTRHNSSGWIQWVVEINQGISSQEGIVPGTPVQIEYLD